MRKKGKGLSGVQKKKMKGHRCRRTEVSGMWLDFDKKNFTRNPKVTVDDILKSKRLYKEMKSYRNDVEHVYVYSGPVDAKTRSSILKWRDAFNIATMLYMQGMIKCPQCGKLFDNLYKLNRHLRCKNHASLYRYMKRKMPDIVLVLRQTKDVIRFQHSEFTHQYLSPNNIAPICEAIRCGLRMQPWRTINFRLAMKEVEESIDMECIVKPNLISDEDMYGRYFKNPVEAKKAMKVFVKEKLSAEEFAMINFEDEELHSSDSTSSVKIYQLCSREGSRKAVRSYGSYTGFMTSKVAQRCVVPIAYLKPHQKELHAKLLSKGYDASVMATIRWDRPDEEKHAKIIGLRLERAMNSWFVEKGVSCLNKFPHNPRCHCEGCVCFSVSQ